ncbi:MAG TPA: hypothetical protein VJZ26_08510 [Blastocatellia bacterium]|nr:hypothetical protein [Blastocatellia bacterium]
MDKIDRLVWAEGLSFISYGVRIGIRANKPGVIDKFLPSLPPGWKPSSSPVVDLLYSVIAGGEGPRPNIRLYNVIYANALRIARVPELDTAIDAFESDLQLYVAEMSPRRVFVHAGVVGWRGQAIIIPGRSFSGKSTLTAELVKAGAIYYSDEYAVLDEQGRVHHYARPLAIRENGDLKKPKKYEVETLGGRRGAKPLPVRLVVVSRYKPGATWHPRQLSAGEGALALLANTVSARREPETALVALNHAVSRATILKGNRGEAGQMIDDIFDKLRE